MRRYLPNGPILPQGYLILGHHGRLKTSPGLSLNRRNGTIFVAELARVPELHPNSGILATSATGYLGQTDGKTGSVKTEEFG